MRINKKGFTLMEVFVVVLIIGILAAIALPQYQLAVEKSRAMSLVSLLQSFSNAAKFYYLANGTVAQDLTVLDIEVPGGSSLNAAKTVATWNKQSLSYCKSCGDKGSFQAKTDTGVDAYIEYYVDEQRNPNTCWAKTELTLQNKVCQHLTNRTTPNWPNQYGRNGYRL